MSKFVTLCSPRDEQERLYITATLNKYGIPYYSKGEHLQNLFGLGSFGTGYNLLTGPIEIQVPEEFVENAKNVIEETFLNESSRDENPIPTICPACSSTTNNQPECPDCGLVF